MRDIKFRGLGLDGVWRYGSLVASPGTMCDITECVCYPEKGGKK